MIDIAVEHGIFKKVSTKIEVGDGKLVFEKHIYKNPEKFFTKEVLEQIDKACEKEFLYGVSDEEDTIPEVIDETE